MPNVVTEQRRKKSAWQWYPGLLCACLLWIGLPGLCDVSVQNRGEAWAIVMSDQRSNPPVDEVAVRILNNTDTGVIEMVARTLAQKLGVEPQSLQVVSGDSDFPDDKSAGAKFVALIVPRGEGYLPLGPFIEAFAPYASRLRITYDIKGQFTYRGYRNPYKDQNVSFTVDLPPQLTPDTAEAFYGFDINIKNSSLTVADIPRYPDDARKLARVRRARIAMAVGAGVIIIAVGLLFSQFLPRRKEESTDAVTESNDTLSGDSHD